MSLFKYVHQDRIDVLERFQIRFTQASSQNDLFEFKPLTKGWKPRKDAIRDLAERLASHFKEADTPEKMLQMAIANHPEAEASFRRTMHLIGDAEWFSFMKKFAENNFESEADNLCAQIEANWKQYSERMFQTISSMIGILSLTEDPKNVVMWGHYANSCQGFAIEFNEKHPWFNQKRSDEDDFRHLRQVTYLRNPYPQYFSELTAHDVCYSKLEDWSYEKEWRILQDLRDGTDTGVKGAFGEAIIVFNVPPDCILGVVAGARASKGTLVAIETALKNECLKHVSLSRQC
jgi:hypothetical protein